MLPKDVKIIIVLSGKGGVGKSTFSVQLAAAIALESKKKTALLDVDLSGPSTPLMLGLEGKSVTRNGDLWKTVPVNLPGADLRAMSIGFLLDNSDSAVIWRGPKKNALIKQFLTDVDWDDTEYLIIDTPPGTSDEHISLVEGLKEMVAKQHLGEGSGDGSLPSTVGAVLITTPQNVSIDDVRREIGFCRKAGLRMIGLIENMAGYTCPHCSACEDIFASEGGRSLAKMAQIPFLTSLPIDPSLAETLDEGGSFLTDFPDSVAATKLREVVKTHLL